LYRHCICGKEHRLGTRCAVAAQEPVDVT
jgi:hypothetical protein